MKRPIASFVVFALSLTGCTNAVLITEPKQPISAPLTTFKVQFSTYFAPGTFNAELDGQDVTQGFVPAAVPGGTSTMRLPDTPDGFTGGTPIYPSYPERGPGVAGGSGPPSSGGAPVSGGPAVPIPLGSGKPVPKITMYHHQLRVSGQCSGIICDTTDELSFFPIHLVGVPTILNLRVGNRAEAMLETYPAISTPLTDVRVRPSNVSVSLDGQPAGTPIMLTIPPNGPSRTFSVTGAAVGNLRLFIEARGTQAGNIWGQVDP